MTSTILPEDSSKHSNLYKSRRMRADSTSTDDSGSTRAVRSNEDEIMYEVDGRQRFRTIHRGPRKIFIKKSETGFGFNVRGQVSEGGPLKLVNGEFYAPLQQVSAVLSGGAAEKAGLGRGDKILEVNGINVDGSTHKQVVDLIKSGGDYLTLVVIAMPCDEVSRMADTTTPTSDNDSNSNNSTDYSERCTVPIRIADWSEMRSSSDESKYIVYNITYADKYLCSKRYKELDMFQSLLKREFSDFQYPHFPRKWPFRLSESQLEGRKNALEVFLVSVCSVRVIYESDLVRDFLNLPSTPEQSLMESGSQLNAHQQTNSPNEIENEKKGGSSSIGYDFMPSSKSSADFVISKQVSLLVSLPDKSSTAALTIEPNATADQVYERLAEQVGLEPRLAPFFYLFEIIDEAFERKLRPHELPYKINVQNSSKFYSSNNSSNKSKGQTSIRLGRWYFNPRVESKLAKNALTLQYLFHQAVECLARGQLALPSNLDSSRSGSGTDFQFLAENKRYLDYLKRASKLEGYGDLVFPHCACSSRKNGHVIVILSYTHFKLRACSRDGVPETQLVEFAFDAVERCDVDHDEMSFLIEVQVANKPNRVITLSTGFYLYMHECVKKIMDERTE